MAASLSNHQQSDILSIGSHSSNYSRKVNYEDWLVVLLALHSIYLSTIQSPWDGLHGVQTAWQWLISEVHSINDEKIFPGWWGGVHARTSVTLFTITYKVVGYAPVEWQILRGEIGWVYLPVVCDGNRLKRGGPTSPPPSPARADFSIMMGCTSDIGNRHSVCTLRIHSPYFIFTLYVLCGRKWYQCLKRLIFFVRHHQAPRILRRQAAALLREKCSPGQRAPPSAVRSSWGMSSTCPVRSAFTS
jgi:hypothetical protein